MKDKLRELAERWKNRDYDDMEHLQWYAMGIRQARDELLAVLDAEGDGGAVAWQEKVNEIANNIGESLNAGCDQDAVDRINVYVDELFALATHPARSGVVSDEGVRDAAMDAALITKAQKIVRDVWETWYPGNEWTPANSMHDLLCQIGNSLLGVPEFASAADSRIHAQNAIDAAIQGERHEH